MQISKRSLGVISLALINVAAVASLRNLPIMANCGLTLFFYYGISTLVFFIPSALVSAELATTFADKQGGLYAWVKEAFGPKWGFFAVWCMTAKGFTYFPAIIAFVAGTIAFLINPHLAENLTYTMCMILAVIWIGTFINCKGVKLSDMLSTTGCLVGTIFPGFVIVALGIYWLISGRPCVLDFSDTSDYLPTIKTFSEVAFLAGTFVAFSGIELSAVHAKDCKDPQKNYPRAILLCAFIVLLISVLGSLVIALVIPQSQMSLDAGIMQAFTSIFSYLNINYMTSIMALCVTLGAIATINTWIISPVKGLHATSENGDLPPFLRKMNKHHVPTSLLFWQAAIVSIFTLAAFWLMPSVNSAFWLLTAITSNIYMLVFILMFPAAIYLRFKKPGLKRPFKVPGGKIGMVLIAGSGFLSTLFVFFIGFVPPSNLDMGPWARYLHIGGTAAVCTLGGLILLFKKASWKKE